MTVDATTLALLAAAALVAGAVDAIGGGGGLIALPALLAAGLPPTLALGTNKGQGVFGSGAALLRYARAGFIDRRRAVPEFAAGAAGSAAGAALVLLLPPHVLRPLVLALLIVAGVVLALRPSADPTAPRRARAAWIAVAIAFVLGAYDGFFGPGTGTFLILSYVWFFGDRLQQASADAKVVNFASNVAAVALFASRGTIVWGVALPMAAGQALGGWIGAHVVVRGGDRVVRAVALLVIATLITKLAFDLLG